MPDGLIGRRPAALRRAGGLIGRRARRHMPGRAAAAMAWSGGGGDGLVGRWRRWPYQAAVQVRFDPASESR
jgi:hypothetical protein